MILSTISSPRGCQSSIFQKACTPHDDPRCVQREATALVRSWTDHLAHLKGLGASPALCELLEEEGDFVPTGPPLADLLASDVHQLQADALRTAIVETYSLAESYKQVHVWLHSSACGHQAFVTCPCGAAQGFQSLLEEAVLANSSIGIPAMEDAYVALVDAPPTAFGATSADSLAVAAHAAGGASALTAGPPSLADLRSLICRLTAQQRRIAAMKKQARSPQPLCWSAVVHRQACVRSSRHCVHVLLACQRRSRHLHGVWMQQLPEGQAVTAALQRSTLWALCGWPWRGCRLRSRPRRSGCWRSCTSACPRSLPCGTSA